MPTPVQRKVCAWIIENGGEAFVRHGHKTVHRRRLIEGPHKGELIVGGNMNLIDGLKANQYVEEIVWGRYRITDAGRKIARAKS